MIIRGRSTHSEKERLPEPRIATQTTEQATRASVQNHRLPANNDGDGPDVLVAVVRMEVTHRPNADAT